jgi:shikimate kinase
VTPRVVLIGMPGAGKTTIGRRVAKLLGVGFLDADHAIVERTGRSIADLFATDGEVGFRTVEAEAIVEALATFDGVFALGGGALTTSTVRDTVAASGVPVVLLTASVRELARRVGDGRTRPLLAGDVSGRLNELADQRGEVLAAVATHTVRTDGLRREAVARQVAAMVTR